MNQIDYLKWEETLKNYLEKIEGELAAVRQAKVELYEMQRQLQEGVFGGRYERDEDTFIISAPNIIIGNVDKHGNLLQKPSRVIIRSNDIELEGVGRTIGNTVSGGSVVTRARDVKVQTVDPGPDGKECVAFQDSSFTVQSASVAFTAENVADNGNNGGVFTLAAPNSLGNITLAAENKINVTAVKAKTAQRDNIKGVIKALTAKAESADAAASANLSNIAEKIDNITKNEDDSTLSLIGKLGEKADSFALRTGLYKYDERSKVSQDVALAMAKEISECIINISNKAEANRVKGCLEKRKEDLDNISDDYDKKAIGSSVNINAENVNITTKGADGNIRTSPGNGVKIVSQNTEIVSATTGKTLDDSTFKVVAAKVDIDSSVYTYDKEGKLETTEAIKKGGHINLNAFQINTSSQDRKYEGGIVTKTTNTERGGIYFNTNEAIFDMHDDKGKARGQFIVNGKSIYLCPDDIKDLNANTDNNYTLNPDGKVQIFANRIDIGSYNSEQVCKKINLQGESVTVDGNKYVGLWSDFNNLAITPSNNIIRAKTFELTGSNISVTGSDGVAVNGKLSAGDVAVANLNISGALEAANIKDGIKKIIKAAAAEKPKKEEIKEVEIETSNYSLSQEEAKQGDKNKDNKSTGGV